MRSSGTAKALLCLLLGSSAIAQAEQEAPGAAPGLRLRDAVAEALAANPAIAAADAQRALADARLRGARAAWLPRLEARESLTRSDNPVFVFSSLLEQGQLQARDFEPGLLNEPEPLSHNRLALSLRYTLLQPRGRSLAVRQARNGVDQAGLAGEETRQRIRVDVIARYYGLVLASGRREVAAAAVRTAEADAEAMRQRLDQGLLVESDLLAAEAHAAAERQHLIASEGEAAIAGASLATVLGRPLDQALDVDASIPDRAFAAAPLAAALAVAEERRGELLMVRKASENAALEMAAVRGERLPRADAFASYGNSHGNSDTSLGLVIAVDLFDGARAARVAAAAAQLAAARAEEAALRDRVRLEVVTAWQRASAAHALAAVAAGALDSAAEAARIVKDRYEQGLTTITELLRARTALVSAQLDLLAARFDDLVGQAELRRATGGLDDVHDFE